MTGSTQKATAPNTHGRSVSFGEAFRVWLRVAALSFGGPAGQIAVMHRILVDEKKWISESRFLHALNYCMLLPGPEAQQLATYIGWLLHRTAGGLVAGTLFVLPGFISILILSVLYAGYQELAFVQAIFFGVKAAVLAVVVEAVLRIGKRVLKNSYMYAIAAAAFIGIFFLDAPFPLIVIGAALIGFLGERFDPDKFVVIKEREAKGNSEEPAVDSMLADGRADHTRPTLGRAVRVAGVWLSLWFAPLIVIAAVLGPDDVFTRIGLFFSKLAVVTFGGAYAVLAYMAQEAVQNYGWLAPGEMLDGLGMAETTPGPLIQVVQFVAFMGAFREATGLDPFTAGMLASVLATWVTFTPCFLWIFLGAPYVEQLRGNQSLSAALSAITAAVVGVVLNLAVWFSLHVVFAEVAVFRAYGLRLQIPAIETIDIASLVLAAGALIAMLRFHAGMIPVLGVSAALGVAWRMLA
ncbi:chromate efflux transporter [Hyphococcus luteus]|uniref:Chromate transporter n=1 Tax=Hyphococcus luteus TaxID=2058213 RepID=A0A2S7K098_9PROT|nr:chromate efflux transporter [Marinicaulis flavus]PQA85858.1 chromate transporter [Marinicaulis flavus]